MNQREIVGCIGLVDLPVQCFPRVIVGPEVVRLRQEVTSIQAPSESWKSPKDLPSSP